MAAAYYKNRTLDGKMLLSKLSSTLENEFNIKKTYSYAQVASETIDNIIDMEVNELQYRCVTEEAEYVKQKLIEYPSEVFRKYNRKSIDCPAKFIDDTEENIIKTRKAESCRKSRLNAKLKHAKYKFSYDYMDLKVKKSAAVLKAMHEIIAHAENNLIAGGLHPFAVIDLRQGMGMKGIDEIAAIDNVNNVSDYTVLEQKKENDYISGEINPYGLAEFNQGMTTMDQIFDISNHTVFGENKSFEMMEIPHNQILSFCN